jgi:hypothetical protein
MTAIDHPHIDPRYCGPPHVANGGLAAGTVATSLSPPLGMAISVTLRAPVPLGVDLTIDRSDEGARLTGPDGDVLAEAAPSDLDLDVPEPPDADGFAAGQSKFIGYEKHAFPGCYVCGPSRQDDGLHIFAGPVPGRPGLVGCSFVPGPEQAGSDGQTLALPFIWAALDCPGYFAAASAEPDRALPAVLGRMVARVDRYPRMGETLGVMGWPITEGERRFDVGTALVDRDGVPIARARSTWVRLRDPSLFQAMM